MTLTDQAYETIEEQICTLVLPPGASLSEIKLSEQLGIGKTPVREALQRLKYDGLITITPRRGAMVTSIDIQSQLRVLEVRRVIEPLTISLATTRATAPQRESLARLAGAMREAGDAAESITLIPLDADFNQLVVDAAQNDLARRTMASINAHCRRFWFQYYKSVGDAATEAHLHADIADAIARNAPADADRASHLLLDYFQRFTRKTLDL